MVHFWLHLGLCVCVCVQKGKNVPVDFCHLLTAGTQTHVVKLANLPHHGNTKVKVCERVCCVDRGATVTKSPHFLLRHLGWGAGGQVGARCQERSSYLPVSCFSASRKVIMIWQLKTKSLKHPSPQHSHTPPHPWGSVKLSHLQWVIYTHSHTFHYLTHNN